MVLVLVEQGIDFQVVGWWMTVLATAVSVVSGLIYVRGFVIAIKAHRAAG